MKIIFLDIKTLGYEIDVSGLHDFGEVLIYDHVIDDEVSNVIADADIIITNQNRLNEKNLHNADKLKLICAAATGYDNIDTVYCANHNIAVTNVPGYAANSVAQHTFSMLFYLISHSRYYDDYVKSGDFSKAMDTIHSGKDFIELEGKTWGIIGLGEIGKKVAAYAECFGCNVIYYSTSGKNRHDRFKSVMLDELLKTSDIISIHAPMNSSTKQLICIEQINQMKKTAYLLNLGRGGIIKEDDLVEAMSNHLIAGAGLDVFETEPLPEDSPLLKLRRNNDNLFLTPHIG
ncbi:MAG TPA: NAD(P)-dependent oxidoreductase, partial [Anaerovoracaceae bacterium]|nr:NAD(P)-dependent oxidoreductase [Anaerovoracaceae bacterium]